MADICNSFAEKSQTVTYTVKWQYFGKDAR